MRRLMFMPRTANKNAAQEYYLRIRMMRRKIFARQQGSYSVHRKKRFTSFPSPAGMSLTKLPLGRNNSVMTSLFPPRESLVVTSRLGTGKSRTFFLRCRCRRIHLPPCSQLYLFPRQTLFHIRRY